MTRIANWLVISCCLLGLFESLAGRTIASDGEAKLNILIVTVDDMSCDSIGSFGCALPETTPNIDRLASQGMRFQHAHVQVGNCMPSRNVMFSGLYPHNNRVEGFYQVRDAQHPHLVDVMQKAGYFVAIRGKVTHSTPYHPYHWDADLTVLDGRKQDMKNANSYYESVKQGIAMAQEKDKPFCLNVNISDPHKPFYAMGKKGEIVPDKNVPTRIFTAEEVPIPGFLFDDPKVRLELAHYYSSVRRADDCVGEITRALEESGERDNTLVMFLSDHGMPLPFAKTALYHHSTRTPWIVHWPGVTKAGSWENEHMVSAVDLLPTLMDIAGVAPLERADGRSFAPVLRGQKQAGRESVFKVYNENSGASRHPMRAVQTKRFLYLFNPWTDGENKFATATRGTMTYRQMQLLAPSNPTIAARLDLFDHRIVEEFYDVEADPDGLNNLIDNPAYAEIIQQHRDRLLSIMKETNDHAVESFVNRNDSQKRLDYVTRVNAEAKARRMKKSKAKKNANKAKPKPNRKSNRGLFKLETPETIEFGQRIEFRVSHQLKPSLGIQKFHITLKDAGGKRIERKVVDAEGTGQFVCSFEWPTNYAQTAMVVSAFVGKDYPSNLLHVTQGPIPVKK